MIIMTSLENTTEKNLSYIVKYRNGYKVTFRYDIITANIWHNSNESDPVIKASF